MGRWPASSPQPAVAAVFRALVVGALVVPMDRGMVMTDHDDLLARVDVMLDMIRRRDTAAVPGVVSLVRDLRAALAAQPDPHVYDVMGVLWRPEAGHGPWSFRTQRAGRRYPEGHEFVTVYRQAVAGSATSTEGPLARGLREDGQWDPRTVIDADGNRGR